MLINRLTSATVVQPPNWSLPFEIMCDDSDYALEGLIRWILILQEFNLTIKDKKGVENVVAFIGLPCLGTLNNLCCSHGRFQKLDALSSRNMMPLNSIFIIEVFDF